MLVHFQILIYSFDLLIVFKSASRVGAKAWPWQSFQYYGHHGHLVILINLLTPKPGVGRRMDTNKARWRQEPLDGLRRSYGRSGLCCWWIIMGFIGPFCQLLWSLAQGPGNNQDNVTNLKVNANKMLGEEFLCLVSHQSNCTETRVGSK